MPWSEPAAFLPFLVVALTINVSPGPDLLYVVAQTLAGDARLGRWAALGIGAGSLCQALLAAAGISSLVAASPRALTALTWAGAAYLTWIGISTLRQPARLGLPAPPEQGGGLEQASGSEQSGGPEQGAGAPVAVLSATEVFRRGMVVNLLNPKVVLFYLTFLPPFVVPSAGPEWAQVLVLGLTFNVTGTLILLGVVEASGWISRQLQVEEHQRRAAVLRKLPGLIFIGLAVRLVWP